MNGDRTKRKSALYKNGGASVGERKSLQVRKLVSGENGSPESRIIELAKNGKIGEAARRAIRLQTAKGLPVTFRRGKLVIKQFPDGREEVITPLTQTPYKLPRGVAIIRGK